MSRLLEDVSKRLLAAEGVVVPRYLVAATPSEARGAAQELGCPVVLKALVPVGRRGKAGAVRFADSPEEAEAQARAILALKVWHFPVDKLLVEEKLEIARELYASISFDPSLKLPTVLASVAGGIEVEEMAARAPEKMLTMALDPFLGLQPYQAKEVWSELGLEGEELRVCTDLLARMYRAFARYDANILEINPLAITPQGKAVAVAVLMGVDDEALYRHPELTEFAQPGSDRAWRPLTELEKQVIEVDRQDPYRGTARYTEMEGGDIGFLCGGGGGSLLMFDTLCRYGGRPANYTEFGGNPPERKVYGLAKGILSKPGVKGFFLSANITNNTQTDIVAEGLLRAFSDMGVDPSRFPILIRLAGVNEARAQELFSEAGIEYHGDDISMEEAARRMVAKMRQAYPGY